MEKLYFFGKHYDTSYNMLDDAIRVNFKELQGYRQFSHVSFAKVFSEAISHEHIHRILFRWGQGGQAPESANHKFDNLGWQKEKKRAAETCT
jgi:hypothetical protein